MRNTIGRVSREKLLKLFGGIKGLVELRHGDMISSDI